MSAQALDTDALALGTLSYASVKNAIAIGSNAQALGIGATALGSTANGSSDAGVIASGAGAVALGGNATKGASATGDDAIAIAGESSAAGTSALAIGRGSSASKNLSIAIGDGAQSSIVGGVALGANSIASIDASVSGFDPFSNAASTTTGGTWVSTTGSVSVGSGSTITRQITGLAAGTNDTDAVNIAQLKQMRAYAAQGWNISVGGGDASNVGLGSQVDFSAGSSGNLLVTKGTDNNNISFELAENIDVSSVKVGNSLLNTNGLAITVGDGSTALSATGFVLNQSYDVLGQLKSQIGGFAIASLGRGLEGAMASQQQGIDPSKATSQVERHFNWNKSFEPLAIDDKRWGNTSYNYDANGQILESSSSDGTVERFRYDSALNINGFSSGGNSGNAADTAKFEQWLSRQGGAISEAKGPNGERVHLTYDSRNRVIERRVEKNGFRIKICKYQWDAKDRLIGCITPTGERWTYHYDPFGRRIFKINASIAQKAILAQSPNVTELEKNRGAYHEDKRQRGNGDMSSETIVGTAYLWDANTIAEEAPLKASGEADWDKATKWHYKPNTFRPIAKETADGELFYIVNDHLGTPREMFSEDGKLVWAAQYRTWGAVHKIWQADNDNDIRGPYPPPIRGNLAFKYDTVEAQAAQTCPIRFQGQWEDAETGLYYNRFRYYDPLAAQYISPDPIGLAGGMRSNGYVHNPSAWIDPWGLAKAPVPVPCCGPSGNLDWSGVDRNGLSRKDHVSLHDSDIPNKSIQGVFSNNAIMQVEDAWEIAKQQGIIPTLDKYGNWMYTIPAPGAGIMGGIQGAKLGNPILNNVTIITKPSSNHVITAFPSL